MLPVTPSRDYQMLGLSQPYRRPVRDAAGVVWRRRDALGLWLLAGLATTVWGSLLAVATVLVSAGVVCPCSAEFTRACEQLIQSLLLMAGGANLVTLGAAWRVVARGDRLRHVLADAWRRFA